MFFFPLATCTVYSVASRGIAKRQKPVSFCRLVDLAFGHQFPKLSVLFIQSKPTSPTLLFFPLYLSLTCKHKAPTKKPSTKCLLSLLSLLISTKNGFDGRDHGPPSSPGNAGRSCHCDRWSGGGFGRALAVVDQRVHKWPAKAWIKPPSFARYAFRLLEINMC